MWHISVLGQQHLTKKISLLAAALKNKKKISPNSSAFDSHTDHNIFFFGRTIITIME